MRAYCSHAYLCLAETRDTLLVQYEQSLLHFLFPVSVLFIMGTSIHKCLFFFAVFWERSDFWKHPAFAAPIQFSCSEWTASLKISQAQAEKSMQKTTIQKKPTTPSKILIFFPVHPVPQHMLKCFAGNWMCLVPSPSHRALVVDAEAEPPEGRAHISKGARASYLVSQPQSLNDLAKTTGTIWTQTH